MSGRNSTSYCLQQTAGAAGILRRHPRLRRRVGANESTRTVIGGRLRPGRFRRLEPEHRWPSVVVSVAITVLVFALAFGSMVSVPALSNRESPERRPGRDRSTSQPRAATAGRCGQTTCTKQRSGTRCVRRRARFRFRMSLHQSSHRRRSLRRWWRRLVFQSPRPQVGIARRAKARAVRLRQGFRERRTDGACRHFTHKSRGEHSIRS